MNSLIGVVMGVSLLVASALAVPVKKSDGLVNTLACANIYRGQCIDTYRYTCMGLAIPGICGTKATDHFVGSDGRLTDYQCCNSWGIRPVGGEVVVTDNPYIGVG